jgi:L-ribulose-5-phosphate 3-epimerase
MNSLITSIGIMQGRLLPKYKGRYQAHPLGYWQNEFPIAASLQFDYIEFILDYNDVSLNPLMSASGLKEIQDLISSTNVGVKSVCADYFMEAPIHHIDKKVANASVDILKQLMHNCHKIGINDIVIPCVDQSSLSEDAGNKRFIEALLPLQELAEKLDLNLSLETDLAPQPFKELLNNFTSNKITVNYDTGNSASLGYCPLEEFTAYGNRISDIHIKDRQLGGGSVLLGTGNAEFNKFFLALSTTHYNGPFIMQVFRDEEGVEITRMQLEWLKKLA